MAKMMKTKNRVSLRSSHCLKYVIDVVSIINPYIILKFKGSAEDRYHSYLSLKNSQGWKTMKAYKISYTKT
jgi:hypothetical protein